MNFTSKILINFRNSHAGGMAVPRPYGFEIDFVRKPISESAPLFVDLIFPFWQTWNFLENTKIIIMRCQKPRLLKLADRLWSEIHELLPTN